MITTWYGYDSLNRLSTVSTGAYGQEQTGTVQTVSGRIGQRDHGSSVRHADDHGHGAGVNL
ncbi:protein of unknown function [Ralstonia solanacearum CMR15]|nr:protein of unknown function [Ralstonia solanacearum CMR15]